MIKEITATGKDLAVAKENAVAALGAGPNDDVNFEILDLGTKGIFGIGARPAKVRAYIELPEPEGRRARTERAEKKDAPAASGSERHGRSRQNRRRGNSRGRGESQSSRRAEIEAAVRDAKTKDTSTMRSVVIPESELTFEKIEAAPGEYRTLDFVRTLIANMGLDAEASLFSSSDGTLRITITGEGSSVLIGHHGDTLDALQYLTNLAGAQKNENGERNKTRVTIDIEGYRAKREDTLRALARRKAEQALKNRKSVMLEPMSAYERRIIHSEVQGIEGVSTNSVGNDSNRKIVIFLTDKREGALVEDEEFTVELTENADE